MPKYTFEIDGQKYNVTSETQPTEEELLALVEQYQTPTPTDGLTPTPAPTPEPVSTVTPAPVSAKQMTEEDLKQDQSWTNASKTIYEWDWQRKNPGKAIPQLSDQGYADFGLEYGGGLAYSDVDLVREGQAIGDATDQEKVAFLDIMNGYDNKAPSWSGAGRAFKNILNPLESPSIYLRIGGGKLASQAVKLGAKNQIKKSIVTSLGKNAPLRYATIGGAEGATYGAGYEALRQRATIRADGQEDYKLDDIGKAAGIGLGIGAGFGTVAGVIQNAIKKSKTDSDLLLTGPEAKPKIEPEITSTPDAEIKLLENAVPEIKKTTTVAPKISEEIERIVKAPEEKLNIVVDKDVGILGKVPYVGKVYKDLANTVLNKIQAKSKKVSALGDLPEQTKYIGQRGLAMGKLESVENLTKKVFNSFNKLTPQENKPVYEFLTGNRTLNDVPQNLRDDAFELRQGIDTVSEVLERNGLLSKEIMEENYGTYLPRLFLKYFNKKSTPMGYLKERKDLDEATKLFLGEIEDVGLLGAKAIEDPISDVVKLGFFKEISKNPNWAVQESLVPFRNRNIGVFHAKSELDRITQEIAEGLRPAVELPRLKQVLKDLKESINTANKNIQKIDQKKFTQLPNDRKYGELRGAYIRNEIYDDIVGANAAAKDIVDSFSRFGRTATKYWKTLKVPLNPPSVVRNFMSNMFLLNLSGVSGIKMPIRVVQALEDIINKGPYTKIAQKYGIASTTFSRQEMVQIKRMYKIAKANKTKSFTDQLDKMSSGLLNFAGDSYGFIETFGKTIKIIDDMKAGKNAETAVYNAQKTLFDYSLVPPKLKQVRQSPFGVPFATFQYKVLPFLLETFIRYPERYRKYMAVPALAAAGWKNENPEMKDEDLQTLRESLADYLKDGGNALVWPWKDDEGRWQFYDWSYIMPWGFYTGIANKVAAEKPEEAFDDLIGLWGGPGINVSTAILTNKDPFTNRDIVDPSGTAADQAKDVLNYTWRTAAPSFLTDIGFAGKMYEAITKQPNYYGDPKITKPQAWWRLVGQNMYPVDPEQSIQTNLYFKKKEMDDLKQYYNKQINEALLMNDNKKAAELATEFDIRLQALEDAYYEYEAKSELPERLKRQKVQK